MWYYLFAAALLPSTVNAFVSPTPLSTCTDVSYARVDHTHTTYIHDKSARRKSSKLSASTDSLEQVKRWANLRGAEMLPGLEVADIDGIRGIVTKEEVKAGTRLVKVPWAATLCVFDNPEEQLCPIAKDWMRHGYWSRSAPYARVASWLLYEKWRGERGYRYDYIKNLPWDMDAPTFWTVPELKELQCPLFEERIMALNKMLMLQHIDLREQNANRKCADEIDLDSFKAAVALAWSRTFQVVGKDGEKRHVMSALGDLFNHNSRCQSAFMPLKSGAGIELRTYNDHAPGSQVYITYGNRNNDNLLEVYGFVEENNHMDDVTVEDPFELFEEAGYCPGGIRNVTDNVAKGLNLEPDMHKYIVNAATEVAEHWDTHINDRLRLLKRLGLKLYVRQLIIHQEGRIASQSLAALRVIMATDKELEELSPILLQGTKPVYKKTSSNPKSPIILEEDFDPPVLERGTEFRGLFARLGGMPEYASLEKRTRMCVMTTCMLCLALYPTTREQDKLTLEALGDTPNPRFLTALRYRIGKKVLLERSVERIFRLCTESLISDESDSTNALQNANPSPNPSTLKDDPMVFIKPPEPNGLSGEQEA